MSYDALMTNYGPTFDPTFGTSLAGCHLDHEALMPLRTFGAAVFEQEGIEHEDIAALLSEIVTLTRVEIPILMHRLFKLDYDTSYAYGDLVIGDILETLTGLRLSWAGEVYDDVPRNRGLLLYHPETLLTCHEIFHEAVTDAIKRSLHLGKTAIERVDIFVDQIKLQAEMAAADQGIGPLFISEDVAEAVASYLVARERG